MEPPARHYLCARCRTAVLICSRCDRGQRYCAGDCAKQVRTQSLQEAGQRYQSSRSGRLKHATRQRRYRDRQTKVTHHGSPPQAPDDLLPVNPTSPIKNTHSPGTAIFAVSYRANLCVLTSCAVGYVVLYVYLTGENRTMTLTPDLEAKYFAITTLRNGATAPLRGNCTFTTAALSVCCDKQGCRASARFGLPPSIPIFRLSARRWRNSPS